MTLLRLSSTMTPTSGVEKIELNLSGLFQPVQSQGLFKSPNTNRNRPKVTHQTADL